MMYKYMTGRFHPHKVFELVNLWHCHKSIVLCRGRECCSRLESPLMSAEC